MRAISAVFGCCWILAGCWSSACQSGDQKATVGASTTKTTGTLTAGDSAPDVSLKLEDGSQIQLSSLKGKQVVLYFYPKDETRGCTIEAQGFRDVHASIDKNNAVVFGVSLQGEQSHQSFIQKEHLPYHLVADTDAQVAKAFGVKVTGEYASRDTVLIDEQGKVKKLWRGVNPGTHPAEVVQSLN